MKKKSDFEEAVETNNSLCDKIDLVFDYYINFLRHLSCILVFGSGATTLVLAALFFAFDDEGKIVMIEWLEAVLLSFTSLGGF